MQAMTYFHNGHLNDTGVSLCAEALHSGRRANLPAPLLHHLSTCTQCRHEVIELYSATSGINYEALGAHPFFDKPATGRMVRPAQRLWPLAAAAAVLTFALVWALRQNTGPTAPPAVVENREQPVSPAMESPNPTSPEERSSHKPKSAPSNTSTPAQDRHAANFTPSESLESLTGLAMRNGNFAVAAPAIGAEISPGIPILFRWNNAPRENLIFTLLNNREQNVFQTQTSASSFTFSEPLAPGLYYWQLETGQDLLYTGKFAVRLQ